MASYQIPQFLDSGDKILLGMNMRQFGYALGGFMVGTLFFSILSPALGAYAVIPISPVLALAAYLAFGKYNGRDSEIYVLKAFLYYTKPRQMVYTRQPDTTDLDIRMAEWTSDKIMKRWTDEVSKQKQVKGDNFASFSQEDSALKAQKIRQLGNYLDTSLVNTLTEVQRKELQIKEQEEKLKMIEAQNLANKRR